MGNHLDGFATLSTINTLEIYVINLDQRPDRRMYMDALLKKQGLNYRRIPAIYGKKFYNITDVCASEGYPDLTCIGSDDRTGHLAHAACYLSHLKCLKLASESIYGKILILEDDAKFIIDDYGKVLKTIADENADFIWLNASKDETEVIEKNVMPTWGLQGYIINRKAAKILYDMLKPGSPWIKNVQNCLIDWIMPMAIKDAKLSWKNISLVYQNDDLGSNIKHS